MQLMSATFYFFMVGDTAVIDPYYNSTFTRPEQSDFGEWPLIDFSLMIMTMVFSVWILNIFIGVIGQAWAKEQLHADLALTKERCGLALNFVLRATEIPSSIWFFGPHGSLRMMCISTFAVATIAGLQISAWLNLQVLTQRHLEVHLQRLTRTVILSLAVLVLELGQFQRGAGIFYTGQKAGLFNRPRGGQRQAGSQTLEGSFLAVSTPILQLNTKYSFESS